MKSVKVIENRIKDLEEEIEYDNSHYSGAERCAQVAIIKTEIQQLRWVIN